MTTSRPPIQLVLDLPIPSRGEAPRPDAREVEAATATTGPESPTRDEHCDPENIEAGLRSVTRNRGHPESTVLPFDNCRAFSARAGRRSKINCSGLLFNRNRSFGCKSRNRPVDARPRHSYGN
jgi:hypothetical protein